MARFFIDRPVFARVLAIFIILAGVLAIPRLAVERYPAVAPPSVSIYASYPGASPQTLNDAVVGLIERELSSVKHLLYFESSVDTSGEASITATFAGYQPGAGAGGRAEPDQGDRAAPAAQRAPERPVRGSSRFRLPDAGRPAFARCQRQRGRTGRLHGAQHHRGAAPHRWRRPRAAVRCGAGDARVAGPDPADRLWADHG